MIPVGALSLCLLILTKLFRIIGSAEIRHSKHRQVLESRAASNIDLMAAQLRALTVYFYTLYGASMPSYLFLQIFLSETVVAYQYFRRIPYYNPFMNQLNIAVSVSVAFSAFSMLAGRINENALVGTVLTLISGPPLVIMVVWLFGEGV